METAKIVLEYLKVFTWPITVIVIALVYRKPLSSILEKLKKAGLPGGVSLDFSAEVIDVRQLSQRVETLPAKAGLKAFPTLRLTEANARMIELNLQPSPSGLDMNYYRQLAVQDPNIALAGLRIELDVLARNLARGFGVPIGERDSGLRLLRRVREEGAITASQFELAERVVRLCNAAIHGTLVSKEQADSVLDSAEVLAEQYLSWLSWGFTDNPAAPEST